MKSLITTSALAALATALVIGLAVPASAQSTNKPAKKEATKEATPKAKSEHVPFKGTIDAVDKIAMTIKVGERTFQVTSATKIIKGGKPATFADAATGEECGGSYKKAGEKMELLSLRIGPKADAAAPAAPKEAKKKSQP